MKAPIILLFMMSLASAAAEAQTRVVASGGDVSRRANVARRSPADLARLSKRIPGLDDSVRARVTVGGDSAQRIAMDDFDWGGRVASLEFDEQDARLFWDVKIVPDTSAQTIVRYRIDAVSGGILGIREFTGIRGLAVRKP